MKLYLAIIAIFAMIVASTTADRVDCSYQKPGCISNRLYRPVCGKNGCNYNNPDLARCGGTEVAYFGDCR